MGCVLCMTYTFMIIHSWYRFFSLQGITNPSQPNHPAPWHIKLIAGLTQNLAACPKHIYDWMVSTTTMSQKDQ